MRCGRADQVELDAFLLGEAGDERLDAFREHYPTCADCSATVADWMAMESALREVLAAGGEANLSHPGPEELAAFAEAPARLGERAMQIENHVASCMSCGGELRLIQGFDPAIWGAGIEAQPAVGRAEGRTRAGLAESLRETLDRFLEQLRGLALPGPLPAFALAAVLLLLGLWLSGSLDRFSAPRRESDAPQLVEQSVPEPPPDSALKGVLPLPTPEGASPNEAPEAVLAESAPPAPEPEASPEPAPESAPVELAQVEGEQGGAAIPPVRPTPKSERPAAVESPAPRSGQPAGAVRSDEVLLASVSDLPPPDYASPSGGGDSLVWMRQFGAVRAAPSEAHIAARAPRDHTGLTLSNRPRLWWALDKATTRPVQITIVDGESIDPLVRVELPGPHAEGLHAFDLAEHGATLSPDVDYRWFVSIVVDPDRPSRNPVSAGSLRVAGPSDARRETVSSADASVRGNKFAELGLWYDAFDFYASLAEAHPEVERIATYRDRLAEVTKAKP